MSYRRRFLQVTVWSSSVALTLGCASSDPGEPGNTGGAGAASLAGSGGRPATGGAIGVSGSGNSAGTVGGSSTSAGAAGSAASAGSPSSGGSGGANASGGSAPTNGGGGAAGNPASAGSGTAGKMGTGGTAAGAGGGTAGPGGAGGGAGSPGAAGAAGSPGAAGAGGSNSTSMSAGCGKAPGIPSSQYNNGRPINIMAGNMQRRYVLSVPTDYDNTRPYRLVVSFHQRDGNDIQNYNWNFYGLLPLSDKTTIFVAPNGQLNGAPCSGTGDGQANCGWPNPNNSDVALADAVVAQIKENFCVDTGRIFATGWSFGGAMSYQMACARPLGAENGYIRGVAVYSGSPQITAGPCPPMRQVAYHASHGTNDNVLPHSGGVTMAQNFAKANSCTWAAPPQASGAHVCTKIAGCMSGYPVEFCSFVGGHTPFPDNGQAQGSWGPEQAWKFLSDL